MSDLIQTISVPVDPPYEALIGPGLLHSCGARIAQALGGACRAAVVTDSAVAPLYLSAVESSLADVGFSVCSHVFKAGEGSKNLVTLSALLEFLAEERLTRTDCVIALGGGVCGDMAGFAAGVYLRGIRCVQLPTTLLAAVDSSVGGKTAVDLRAGKNLAGVFLQPSAVLCDTRCLATLPPAALADGAAAAIKTGVLSGEELFGLWEHGDPLAQPEEMIARCVAHKAAVVAADPFDTGVRRTLNLGHTAGHAIETCSGYAVSHGHAVAAGLAIIARASARLGWSEAALPARIEAVLRRSDLPITSAFSARELAEAALADKKRTGGDITLVIPEAVGRCTLKKLPVTQLSAVFAAGLEG